MAAIDGELISMPHRQYSSHQPLRPGPLFSVLLLAIFGVEFAVMLVLPVLMPAQSSLAFTAIVDACSLTAVLAPVLSYLVVRPLQRVAVVRQRMLAAILSAQEDERRRIARDLHDELGQSLTRLLVGLRTIEESSSQETVCLLARDLRRIGTDTHEEIRRLARGLRPAVLDDMGLVPALERLINDLVAVQDVDARIEEVSPELPRLPPEIETVLYRISQEAFSNATRHGAATEIRLRLDCTRRTVRLLIRDNGCGFDAAAQQSAATANSFGLLGMRERAALCDGRVSIQSLPGNGCLIEVQIPIPNTPLE